MPCPNARWGRLARVGSKRSRSGSPLRLAAESEQKHQVARLDAAVPDRDVRARDARERDLDDGEVAQQLVDERVDRGAVGDQRAPQLRVAEQHDRAERQHARGGLQPAGEQAVGQARQLVVGDVVAVLAHQHAEHAVAGLRALALDHVEQVGEGLRDRPNEPSMPPRKSKRVVTGAGNRPGPRTARPAARRSSVTGSEARSSAPDPPGRARRRSGPSRRAGPRRSRRYGGRGGAAGAR